MISVQGNYRIVIKGTDDRPVEAWDDDGHPMVVGLKGLVRAERLGEPVEIDRTDVEHVAAVLPGGGWHVKSYQDGQTRPVFAWVIDRTGWTWPTFMEPGASHAWVSDTHGEAIPPDGDGQQ